MGVGQSYAIIQEFFLDLGWAGAVKAVTGMIMQGKLQLVDLGFIEDKIQLAANKLTFTSTILTQKREEQKERCANIAERKSKSIEQNQLCSYSPKMRVDLMKKWFSISSLLTPKDAFPNQIVFEEPRIV